MGGATRGGAGPAESGSVAIRALAAGDGLGGVELTGAPGWKAPLPRSTIGRRAAWWHRWSAPPRASAPPPTFRPGAFASAFAASPPIVARCGSDACSSVEPGSAGATRATRMHENEVRAAKPEGGASRDWAALTSHAARSPSPWAELPRTWARGARRCGAEHHRRKRRHRRSERCVQHRDVVQLPAGELHARASNHLLVADKAWRAHVHEGDEQVPRAARDG